MKISVISARYAISGVPLAQLRLARALAASGHKVELVFGLINSGYRAPEVDGVPVRVMGRARVSGMLLPLCRYLQNEQPDVIFSAGDHLNTVVLLAAMITGSKAKISCSSRVTPFDTYSHLPFTKRWFLKWCMRTVMPRADAMTCVSHDMVEQYRRVFKSPPHVCVYNIVSDSDSAAKQTEAVDEEWFAAKNGPILIAAGSLVPWKGFRDLILAMSVLRKSTDAKLLILGDGPLRAELQELIEGQGLAHAVKLAGYVDNPLKYFSRSDIFVLSSHVEGMPNVLVEAMMCGCTPVSTNCPTGPRELLQDGKAGYLVPVNDPVALAAGLRRAIEQPIAPQILGEAIKPFSAEVVLGRHFELLGIRGK